MLGGVAALGWGVRTGGRWRTALLIVGVAFFWLAVAARPNGIVPVALTLLVAWPAMLADRAPVVGFAARLAVVGAICLGIVLSQTAAENWWIKPRTTHPQQVMFQNDLVGMSLRTGEVLLPATSVREGTTVADLDAFFDYGNPTPVYWDDGSPLVMGPSNYGALRRAWVDAVREHPMAYLGHRIAMAAAVLGITHGHPQGTAFEGGGRPEDFGLTCPLGETWLPSVRSGIQSLLAAIERTGVWRGWTWLVALIGFGAVAGFRRNREALALAVAGSVSLVSVALAAGSITFRYSWFTVVCALVVGGLALERVVTPIGRRRLGMASPDQPGRRGAVGGSLPSGGAGDAPDDVHADHPDPVLQRGGDPSGHTGRPPP
jgi:hypothetical protein